MQENVQLFKSLLLPQKFIANLGFTYLEKEESYWDNELLGRIYHFKFIKNDRTIEFHFNETHNQITVNIDNEGPVDEDEDQAVEYSFSLEQWLDRKGISPIKYPFRLNSYEGTLQAQMQQFFAFLDQALQDDTLQKILRRETWDYVSFDWGDMK